MFNSVVRKHPGFAPHVKAHSYRVRGNFIQTVSSLIPVSEIIPARESMFKIADLAMRNVVASLREPVEYTISYPKHHDLVQYKAMIVRAMDHPLPDLPLAVPFSAFPYVTKHSFEKENVVELVLQKAHVVATHTHIHSSSTKEAAPVNTRRGETV